MVSERLNESTVKSASPGQRASELKPSEGASKADDAGAVSNEPELEVVRSNEAANGRK